MIIMAWKSNCVTALNSSYIKVSKIKTKITTISMSMSLLSLNDDTIDNQILHDSLYHCFAVKF